jgi:predicted nucleic acid-binding protein
MTPFPDTSFLYAVYRPQDNSAAADRYMGTSRGAVGVSSLLLLEFRQSIRFQVWLNSTNKSKGFSRNESVRMLADFQSDLANNLWAILPVDWPEVHKQAEALSAGYTAKAGHRLIDIMHVATAIHLGAREFLTFDARQKSLAAGEGLVVPF